MTKQIPRIPLCIEMLDGARDECSRLLNAAHELCQNANKITSQWGRLSQMGAAREDHAAELLKQLRGPMTDIHSVCDTYFKLLENVERDPFDENCDELACNERNRDRAILQWCDGEYAEFLETIGQMAAHIRRVGYASIPFRTSGLSIVCLELKVEHDDRLAVFVDNLCKFFQSGELSGYVTCRASDGTILDDSPIDDFAEALDVSRQSTAFVVDIHRDE